MLSFRALSRTVPRSVRGISSRTFRAGHSLCHKQILSSPSWRQQTIIPFARSAFSTSTRFMQEYQVNEELAAKLESELSMEKEMRDADITPPLLREYLDNSPFELHDTPGKEEVVLTRKFGDENIRVTFSIDDLNNMDEDPDQMHDESALMDDMDEQMDGPNGKRPINQGGSAKRDFDIAPEDSIAPSDPDPLATEEKDTEVDQEPSFPAHVYVTVERPNKGAIQIEAIAQDGLMVIDNVYYYREAKLADPSSIENQIATRDLYTGPPFGNLDEDLQVLFERYLDERGINTALALFIPEYIDYKEQKEYLSWLEGVKSFVED